MFDLQIIDNEFTYVGPMAFDLGLLLSHYMITYHQHMLTEQDNDGHRRVSYKMMDVIRDSGMYRVKLILETV